MDVKTRTRARILDAAERLFAGRGVADVSLREIGAAAGQRNNSAVQYHFGTREVLVRALYEERLAPLNARRLALLADLDAAPEGDGRDLHALVDCYLRPLAEAMRDNSRDSHYARFIHRFTLEGAPVSPPLGDDVVAGIRVVTTRISDTLAAREPGLSEAKRAARLRLMQLLVTATLADAERRLAEGAELPLPFEELTADLLAAAVGLLGATATARD